VLIRYNNLYYFDFETLTWYKVKPNGDPPVRRCGHSSCVFDGKIWIFGGRTELIDGSWFSDPHLIYLNDLYCYDPTKNEWIRYEPRGITPSGRSMHTATIVDRKMYVFGGATSSGNHLNTSGYCDLYELDIDTLTWHESDTKNTPPSPCYGHSATYIGDKDILFFGGKGYQVHNSIHILDTKTMTWREYSYAGNTLSPRWGHSASLFAKSVILYGGRQTEGYLSSIDFIDPEQQLVPINHEHTEKDKMKLKIY